MTGTKADLQRAIEERDRELVRVRGDLDAARARSDAFVGEIQQLRQRLAGLETELEQSRKLETEARQNQLAYAQKVKALSDELKRRPPPTPAPPATAPEGAPGHRAFLEAIPPGDESDYPVAVAELARRGPGKGGAK